MDLDPVSDRDDLGRSFLESHPRGGEWAQLEVTAATLTFDHVSRLSAVWTDSPQRQQARDRLLEQLVFFHGRLGSRWVRWADTFGLALPAVDASPSEVVASPFGIAEDPQRAPYAGGVLPLYDAAIAILAGEKASADDYALLSQPWRQVCLPTPFTTTSLFGRHTQPALASLRAASGFPRSRLAWMVRARRGVEEAAWSAAASAVDQASIDVGFPYRSRSLYWEAVAAAEVAAEESPTDLHLAQALWGYAAVEAFRGKLASEVSSLLRAPYRAVSRVVPPV